MSVLFKDKITGLWKRAAANLIYASFPVGSIVAYGGSSDVDAPTGCMYCHGQVLNANDYPDLYDVIGTKFGVGDGSTGSFSLPDLQGQFLRGAGTNRDSTQGNGGTVGQRQQATLINKWTYGYNKIQMPQNASEYHNSINNPDSITQGETGVTTLFTGTGSGTVRLESRTVRPTNTSVEWIIKVVK